MSLSARLDASGFGSQTSEFSPPDLETFARPALGTVDAIRFAQVFERIVKSFGNDSLMITELKKAPGKIMATALDTGPVLLADGKRRDADRAMLLPADDVKLLMQLITKMITFSYQMTGADLPTRFARAGAPSTVSLTPPPEEAYVSPTLHDMSSGAARRGPTR